LNAIRNKNEVNKIKTSENERERKGRSDPNPPKPVKPRSTSMKRKTITPMAVYNDLKKFCEKSDNEFAKTILIHCTDKKKHWRSIVLYTIEILMMMGRIK
jgi:hypothetical protein